jgi:hypothetical protein
VGWDSVQTIGTIVSVLAVVLSVVGLAVGVRQNTRALNSQNYATALGRLAAMQARLGSEDDTARMFTQGIRDSSQLTAPDRVRLAWHLYEMFGIFEFMFHQSRAGALPPQMWDRWAATTSWWLSYPGIQTWWTARPTPFSGDFTRFVDDCIRTPLHDPAAVSRWRDFLGTPAPAGALEPPQPEPQRVTDVVTA